MPTLHREAGYIFLIVMFDCLERRHVHVTGNGKGGAKVWLEPIELGAPGRYNEHEIRRIVEIVRGKHETIIRRWDEECARARQEQEQ